MSAARYSRNQLNVISQFDAIHKLFQTGAHISIINDQSDTNIDDYLITKDTINQIVLGSTIPLEELVFGTKFPKTLIIINNNELFEKYHQKLMPIIEKMQSSQLYGDLFTLNIMHVYKQVDVIQIIDSVEKKLHRLQLKQITTYFAGFVSVAMQTNIF